MNNDYISKFYDLGYTHTELEELLKKVSDGEILTKEQYDVLLTAVNIVTNLTTFDGTYESLNGKPDIVDTVKQSNEFVSYNEYDRRMLTVFEQSKQVAEEFIAILGAQLSASKADKDHKHDDRYSFSDHRHDGIYVTQTESKVFVTKDYLETVIMALGNTGGGGGVYPTYTQPKLTARINSTIVPHKQPTSIIVTPTYTKNDAGELINFTIRRDGETVYSGKEIKSYSETRTLNHGESITYTFSAEYEDGPIKNTALGTPYPDTMIKAGTIITTVTVRGNANSYYGIIEDKGFAQEDIVNLTSVNNTFKSQTYLYTLNNQKIVYMYPKSFGLLTSIKDANNFDYIGSYDLISIVFDDVEYNVYVLKSAVTTDSGFKQVYS